MVKAVLEFVTLESVSDETAKLDAPLLFLHAGPGAGKSEAAAEIHERLAAVVGKCVMMCIALTVVAASNLQQGSMSHPNSIIGGRF